MVLENLVKTQINKNIKYIYFYRLTKEKVDITYDLSIVSLQSYGIEIERQSIIKDKLIDVCRDSVMSISPDRYKVHKLLRLLYENQVSPIHLVDIIGDYVDEYILDFDKEIKSMA
ncbi:hypothetical protein J2Z42_002207 [Clostridium algifaecis]|uniref:Uncharacterized protein n=1 Tax=Clostridium algifaecis TaxID=1472040 RepID=A0ABS4KX74_9CLOT|nr:DUF6514 family protein [Clostridium algifaecis]MBP2033504.1 hypothetical protein [Clostridium algifaecis]